MPFERGSGAKATYRGAHPANRAALVHDFTPGDPCCLCGHPMWPDVNGSVSHLHADHEPGTDRYRGLAHGTQPCQDCGVKCNVVDGAKRGRERQTSTTLEW